MLWMRTKTHYSETEAAHELGVSVEQLRSLVRHHIVDTEDEAGNIALATYQPSDLLLIRLLAGLKTQPTDPD